ncbi:MAG: UTP--glucose-1-phosphate uridylyltransferase [Planctomycetota bacterium]
MNLSISDWRARMAGIGQGHVTSFWPEYNEIERAEFIKELELLDLDLVQKLAKIAKHPEPHSAGALSPPDVIWSEQSELDAERRGRELIDLGKVAFVLVAGGQATRLGFDQPKGCYPIGPISNRSLFQMHADRLRAIGRRSHGRQGGRTPLWFIMTSPANHAATIAFFDKNEYFNISPDRIVFFPQATVPAFDTSGRLVLESKSQFFRNPNGHGGSLWALAQSGFLNRCRAEGIEHLYYWQVDNPLARLGDPRFMGLHTSNPSAGMSSKIVQKRGPGEKVGVLAKSDGRHLCVEYSDLPAALRDARDAAGHLLYRAGNIAIHAFRVEFVESLTRGELQLPWHRAVKKIRSINSSGAAEEIEGIKFETFVFDALPLSESTVTLEAKREDEFAPVKNAEGEDSPASSRDAICYYYNRWMRKAGIVVPATAGEMPKIEIHPLFAFDFAEFKQKLGSLPQSAAAPVYLGEDYK